MTPPEATEEQGKIYLNGYFKSTLIGFASFVVASFVFLGTNVIANDRKYMEKINSNGRSIENLSTKLDFIIENQNEFKHILRRTVPNESR